MQDPDDWDFGVGVDPLQQNDPWAVLPPGDPQHFDLTSDMSEEVSTAARRAVEAAELAAAGVFQAVPDDDVEMLEAEERAKRMRQQPPAPEPVQLPPGMAAFAALLDNKFAEQNAANEKTFKSTLKQVISEEVGPVRDTVNVLQKEQERQGTELKQLQATVKHLQTQQSSTRSESGQSMGSDGSTRAGFGNNSFAQKSVGSFVPAFIQIKGWGNADPQMIVGRGSRNLAEINAQRVITILMDDAAAEFETTDGQKNTNVFNRESTETFNSNKPWGVWQIRIFFKPTVSRTTVWEIRNLWKRRIEDKYAPLAAEDAFGEKINARFQVMTEVEPHKQPQSRAANRLIATFHKHKSKQAAWVRVEYGPATVAWCHGSTTAGRANELCFGVWQRGSGWKLTASELKKINPAINCDEWQAQINADSW